ncbi:hypothetical protein Dimus_013657, partial [Dionaea muscipula]
RYGAGAPVVGDAGGRRWSEKGLRENSWCCAVLVNGGLGDGGGGRFPGLCWWFVVGQRRWLLGWRRLCSDLADGARSGDGCEWAADSAAVELPFSLGCGSVLRGGRRRLEVARGGG